MTQSKDQQFTEAEAGYRLTAAMTSLVGFPRSFLRVQVVCSVLFVCSQHVWLRAARWPNLFFLRGVRQVESPPGYEIPLDFTRDLVAAYAEQPNPMAAFSKVTGCDEKKVRALEYGVRKSPADFIEALVPDILDAGCSEKFYKVYKTARTSVQGLPFGTQGGEVRHLLRR